MAVTLAAVGAWVAANAGTISAVVSVASAAATAAGSVMQGRQQNKIARANAAAKDQEARDRALQGSIAAERERRRNRAILASQEASAAESGAFSGSTLDLLDNNSVALEMDALTVEFNGQVGAGQSSRQASILRVEGSAAQSGGLLTGIGQGIGAAGQAFSRFDPLNVGG